MPEKPKFRSVSINAPLVSDIEEFLHKHKRYRSIADFVTESCRLRLESLERLTAERAIKAAQP